MKKLLYFVITLALVSCTNRKPDMNKPMNIGKEFDAGTLTLDQHTVKQVTGQLLYLPVYSNVPYQFDTSLYDMSAFLAIHNTDLYRSIRLIKVLYFNQDGKLVDDFLQDEELKLAPLAAKEFYIPYEDKSGTGANFLIEWVSDTLVTEPLVESVTLCLRPSNTVAILSTGKIIRERR